MQNQEDPWVEILIQPKAKGFRFRYECEGRSAGSIPGDNSTNENKTYPTIKIHNITGDAIVVVSAMTKDQPPACMPHPHSLVGKDCEKGVCTVRLKKSNVATFPNLGIQCAKKKEVTKALNDRKEIRVDPFNNSARLDQSNIDLTVVRLCFQVFLPDSQHRFQRHVPAVVSQCIYDKKAISDLVICRISKQAGSVKGGDEIFMLCEKVQKDDIAVRFYLETSNGQSWEDYGVFGIQDVHRQYAIVLKTPSYQDTAIEHSITVKLQLKRPSDGQCSEPLDFQYIPEDRDPHLIHEKRKRKRTNQSDIGMADIKQEPEDSKGILRRHINGRITSGMQSNIYGQMTTDVGMHASPMTGGPLSGMQGSPMHDQASGITQGLNNINMAGSPGPYEQQHAQPLQQQGGLVVVQPVPSEDVLVPQQEIQQFPNEDVRLDSDIRVDSETLNCFVKNMEGGEFMTLLDQNQQNKS